jgi:prephenate dehydrogenase
VSRANTLRDECVELESELGKSNSRDSKDNSKVALLIRSDSKMTSQQKKSVLIIGGEGEFGGFLRRDILPSLGVTQVSVVERETPREEHGSYLATAHHVVLATPLAGYAERACELIYQSRTLNDTTTFWLIASVQAGIWRAVSATLELVANPRLSAVFLHPMYGPNGFRETEPEARTFQNVLTATYAGAHHPLDDELTGIINLFLTKFNIRTTASFNPDEHDRVTAYSQGLSYCVARLMFERPELDQILREEMSDLHHSFSANRDLILDFLRINSYMPQVIAAFRDAWLQTNQSNYYDLLNAFARADAALNQGTASPISTKWYEKLRASAREITGG